MNVRTGSEATPPAYPGPVDDVGALLLGLRTHEPGRPRITWYGPGGERIELSGKVLDNWVAKTAGLLVDELDAGPGVRVLLDLPPHWRTVTWTLATWLAGACAVLPGPAAEDAVIGGPGPDRAADDEADVLVTTDPATAARRPHLPCALVALPALATSFGPGLPDGALDAAADVRLQGDVFVASAPVDPAQKALVLLGRASTAAVTHRQLLSRARAAAPASGARVLLAAAAAADPLTSWLPPLCVDGSVVLHHDLAGLSERARQDLAAAERVSRPAP